MVMVSSAETHWLENVARQADLTGSELSLPSTLPVEEAWQRIVASCGIVDEELARVVADRFSLDVADFDTASPAAVKLVPASVAEKFRVFPLRLDYRQLILATSEPGNVEADQAAAFASGRSVVMAVAPPKKLNQAIGDHYSTEGAVEMLLDTIDQQDDGAVEVLIDEPREGVGMEVGVGGPVTKLTNLILRDAVLAGASDIHIQPAATSGVVRFRIDGMMRQFMQMPMPILTRVISRIKVMGNIDITDRLRPQDGHARLRFNGRKLDLRISTVPTRSSEKAVIRILDPSQSKGLDDIGLPPEELARFRSLLSHREGIVLVTGPTGSGKTTTLYGALRDLTTDDVNIMTVEDPIEYELPGLTQIQVEVKQGVTFPSVLRACLRQDPDIILVGEIRDLETAKVAIQASMTGHLVLSTLHTNDAVASLRRLADLGLDAPAIVETLRGALAQRLVRRVCPDCRVQIAELTAGEAELAAVFGVQPEVRAVGCDECSQTGYRGRFPLIEVFVMTPTVAEEIRAGASNQDIVRSAQAEGMRTLREAGVAAVERGDTTLEELQRVLGDVGASPEDESVQPAVAKASPEVASPSTRSTEPEEAEAGSPEPPPHVLVVDDDGTARMIARAVLQKDGYMVTEAADGVEALTLLRLGVGFDLMVLDVDMPEVGGPEVLREVRQTARTAALPVIVLTGDPDPETEVWLLELGADDFIRKPLEPTTFSMRVQAVLRRARG